MADHKYIRKYMGKHGNVSYVETTSPRVQSVKTWLQKLFGK